MAHESYFTRDDEWFRPTAHCRGPWTTDACHAGPPTGLLAKAAEMAAPDKRLVRLTVNITRPIPFAGFRVEADLDTSGRSVATATTRIIGEDDKVAATAHALLLAQRPAHPYPTTMSAAPSLAEAEPGPFPITTIGHGEPAFPDFVETRYPPGQDAEPGPTTLWLKGWPLLPDTPDSPFQSVCFIADCGNAFSRNADVSEYTAINPDLTIVLHRPPVSEWIGASSVSRWEQDGIGMSDTLLFDEHGAIGRAIQTLLVSATPKP